MIIRAIAHPVATVLAASLLAACAGPLPFGRNDGGRGSGQVKPEASRTGTDTGDDRRRGSATPPSARQLFRGTLRRDADRLLLELCGDGETLRLRDVSPESSITAALTDVGFDRQAPLHFEGFGRRQDGELWVDRLNRAGREMNCTPRREIFRAQGNEPGWSLVSDNSGLRLLRLGMPTLSAPPLALTWRWPDGRRDRAEARLEGSTEASALTAVLLPKLCRDTMADAVYGFTAAIRLTRPGPAVEYRGCAYLEREPLP